MAISATVKNHRDGQIEIEDATGTPISMTVQYEAGDFSISGLTEGQKEIATYYDRGDLCSVRKTTQTFPTFSFTAHMTDLSDATEKCLLDVVNKGGAWSSGVSTLGANADVWATKVTFTCEGTDHGDTADHVTTLDDCRLSIDFSEGDPNTFSLSGQILGAISFT